MKKIQDLIMEQNQRTRKINFQKLILLTQYLYSVTWIFIAAQIIDEQSRNDLQFKLIYFCLPTLITQLGIKQIIIQSITLFTSLAFLFSALFGGKYTLTVRIVDSLWDVYPNIIQIMIIQNSGYCLLVDEVNFSLGVVNIILAIFISQSISIYSFTQNDSQLLIKTFLDRSLIPLCFSLLAVLAGLQLHNSNVTYIYLGLQIGFDIYYGIYYYIRPNVYYLSLQTMKLSIQLSFIRVSLVGALFQFQANSFILISMLSIPFVIHLHLILWDKRFIQFIYQSNILFQHVCIGKFNQYGIDFNTLISYYFEIIKYKKPLNRVLMLGMFCNHMNMCSNVKCFCVNRNFYDNVQISSNLRSYVDIAGIKQQLNFVVGEKEIETSYKQLLLLFFDNLIKNTRYTIMGESAILKLSLYEISQFRSRLFQTKLRFQFLTIYYHQLHPHQIEKTATFSLITKELQTHIGGIENSNFNIPQTLLYFSLLDEIKHKIYKVVDEKMKILEMIQRNYQNAVPYYLNELNITYRVLCNNLERQIQMAISLNGVSLELRDIQNDFYAGIKYDYHHKNKIKNTQIHFVNQNPTSFVICEYQGDLIIKQYSNNFPEMIQMSSQVKGGPIEQIVPVVLQQYHRQAIAQMIKTGETKLVNKDQYVLLVKSQKYVLEVDALLRLDYRHLQFLNFIGFIQQRENDSIVILANEKGVVDSYSRAAANILKLDTIDMSYINYFQLSPNLLKKQSIFEYDGLILIPKRCIKLDHLQYYKYFIVQPNECYIFIVNAIHTQIIYSSVTIYSLKINQCYQLKDQDFKIFALDLMIRQVMLLTKISNSQYFLSQDSMRRMDNIKKNFQTILINYSDNQEEEYNLSDQEDSERQLGFVSLSKTLIPEFITSIDSIRTQQDRLIIKNEQYKEFLYQQQSKDRSFEQQNKYEQQIKNDLLDQCYKTEQDSITKQHLQQVIEIELKEFDDENIEDQIQQLLTVVKKRYSRNELINIKNQIQNNYKASVWQSSNNSKSAQKKLIKNMVIQFQNTKIKSLLVLKLFSLILIFINIGFICGFIINTIFELEGIQKDSNNQTYPLLLFQDVNVVILGIILQDQNPQFLEIGLNFIITGSDQYSNLSIWINDEEHDYHLFLQHLDKEDIIITEQGITMPYKTKYFLKNYMIEKLRQIEGINNILFWSLESQFFIMNYPSLSNEFWNMKSQTTNDVQERITVLNQMSQLLLTLSIIINLSAIMIYIYILIHILRWRNILFSTLFLFTNISSYINDLSDLVRKKTQQNDPKKRLDDEEKNKSLFLQQKLLGLLIFFCLAFISLGFYIPIFIYIDSINSESVDVNQLQTELTLMQLKQSSIFTWYFLNQTEIKYNTVILFNKTIIKDVIEKCTQSEDFILYNLPFNNKYDFFPEIQQYSSTPLCNCTLLEGQLMNGYNGFQSYVSQHLTDKERIQEIMQAYQIVMEYQIKTRDKLILFMANRLQTTQETLITILIISIALILLIQGSIVIAIQKYYHNVLELAKYMLYLFTPQVLGTNKYLLQILIQNSSFQ